MKRGMISSRENSKQRKAYKAIAHSPTKKGGEAKMALAESHKWFNSKKTFPKNLRGKWVSVANKKIIWSAKNLSELIEKTEQKTTQEFLIAKIPISKNACCGLRFLK